MQSYLALTSADFLFLHISAISMLSITSITNKIKMPNEKRTFVDIRLLFWCYGIETKSAAGACVMSRVIEQIRVLSIHNACLYPHSETFVYVHVHLQASYQQ